MQDLLFIVFALTAIISAVLVVANPFSRSPVNSAMFLVVTIIALSGLFVLLQAYFLAAVQVLVYAGAVMVLFLFVIMMLNLQEEEHRQNSVGRLVGAALTAGLLVTLLFGAIWGVQMGEMPSSVPMEGGAGPLGKVLFLQYVLPFEIISVLLLVAMVGVILLSRKGAK